MVATSACSLSAIARSGAKQQGKQPRSQAKQLDRFLSNPKLDTRKLWLLWVAFLLSSVDSAVVAIDWTSLQNDQYRALWVCLCTEEGRAIPLMALTIPTRKLRSRQQQKERQLLHAFREAVPQGKRVVLLADRGFGGIAFRTQAASLGFDFIVRMRGNIYVRSGKSYQRARAFTPKAGSEAVRYDEVEVTAQAHRGAALVAVHDQRSKTPWLLLTSLTHKAQAVCTLYSLRFQIEEFFRDLKNLRLGMGMDHVQLSSPERWSRLLLLASVAYTVQRRVGQLAKEMGLDRQFSTRGHLRGRHSTFSLGHFHADASPLLLSQAIGSVQQLGFATLP